MATSESIGGISVAISGDLGPLQAVAGPATALSAKIGNQVAQGFNTGAQGANQFDAAIQALTSALAEQNAVLSLSIQRNMAHIAVMREGTRAAHEGVSEMQATSGALRVLEGNSALRAAERFLTTIPGLGAALQYAFPVVGLIALFEGMSRLLGKSEELKAAEKELADATNKADEAFANMQGTLDRLNVEHVKAIFGAAAGTGAGATVLEQQTQKLRVQMDDLRDSINEVAYAEASSLKNYIPFHSDQASIDKIKALGQQYKELAAILQETQGKAAAAREDQGREAQQQAGQLGAKQIEAAEQASARQAEISKQQYTAQLDLEHAAETDRIAGLTSEYARTVQTGEEEIRFAKAKADEINGYALATRDRAIQEIAAKAGAELAGKAKPEQALIYAGAQADTSKAKQEYTLAVDKGALDSKKAQQAATLALDQLNRKLAETLNNDLREGWDRVAEAARKAQGASAEAAAKDATEKIRILEIQDKGAGEQKALQIQAQKIALEAQYGAQVTHSAAQKISQAQALAGFDAQERAAKLQGLQDQLRDAQALDSTVRDKEKEGELEVQISNLKQQNANADAQASATLDQMNQKLTQQLSLQQQIDSATNAASSTLQSNNQQLGQQLGDAVGNLPKEVGDDIGNSIANALLGHHPGESIGQAMAKALVDSLKATAAKLLSQLISTGVQFAAMAVGFADGTNSAPGGMAWVGEKGPNHERTARRADHPEDHAIKGYAGWHAGLPVFDRVQLDRVPDRDDGTALPRARDDQPGSVHRPRHAETSRHTEAAQPAVRGALSLIIWDGMPERTSRSTPRS